MFQHPDMPDFDEGDGDKCKAWIAKQGLTVARVSLESAEPAIATATSNHTTRIAATGSLSGQKAKAGSALRYTTLTMARSAGGRAAR